jgi:phosphoesterase RecJ-like protein
MDQTYKAIADLIHNSDSFLIASHIDADGDAVGSQLAIYSVIKRLGKSAQVVSEDEIPQAFRFLAGSGEVRRSATGDSQVGMVVDAAALDRIGQVQDAVRECDLIVNIDHHVSNVDFGDYNLVDPGAGACGEIIYRLLDVMGMELTPEEAEALFAAILSDTGCFRFPTTTGETLRVAAGLIEAGARPYHVASEIFWKRSPAGLRLLGSALSTIEVTNSGTVATMEITQGMYLDSGATSRDTEGFANYPRSIKDVKVGVLIREIGDGLFRVSLRSSEDCSVDGIAKQFGGGGHATAAGFRIEGELGNIKARIREQVGALIPESGAASSQ